MKSVVITGVSSGLGEALFRILSDRPLRLYAISRTILPYQQEIQRRNRNVTLKACDFSLEGHGIGEIDLEGALPKEECEEIVFINNAGTIEPIRRIGTLSAECVRQATDVNFLAPVILCDKLYRLSKSVGSRFRVINISTGAAIRPVAGWPMYCATKAGFRMFLEVLREQSARDPDVAVFHVDPGVMDTDMQEKIRRQGAGEMPDHDYFLRLEREGGLLRPIDVARGIVSEYLGP